MIAWYAHHQGAGHITRASTVGALVRDDVVILSSGTRPATWPEEHWVQLPPDDAPGGVDPTAGGALHWAPLGQDGYRERMQAIAEWTRVHRPSLLVSDVSAEVALLARLLGLPVVVTVMAGDRSDRAHRATYDLASALVAPWPREAGALVDGWRPEWDAKATFVGAFSRFDARPTRPPPGGRHVTVLWGSGGSGAARAGLDDARAATPGWTWTVCGGSSSRESVWQRLQSADVVVTHGGQNAIAEVAAARRPAIVIPEPRPHDEQVHLARGLARLGLGHPQPTWPAAGDWPDLLTTAASGDPARWSQWADGSGASRYAARLDAVARSQR